MNWTKAQVGEERHYQSFFKAPVLKGRFRAASHPELRADEIPLLGCHQHWKSCAKRSCGKGTVPGIAMRSPRGPEHLSHGDLLGWEPCLTLGVRLRWPMAITFINSRWKGNWCWEFMSPLKCSQQPESLCCPCSTYFWVSRAVCAVPGWQIAVPWPGAGDVTSSFRPTCICMLASILFPI